MQNGTEIMHQLVTCEYGKGSNNLIRRLASYTSPMLQAKVDLAINSLGMAAAAIDTSNELDLRRWNGLAKLATEVIDARLELRTAMEQWSDVVESETENHRRERALLAAMAEFDEVTKIFNDFGLHF